MVADKVKDNGYFFANSIRKPGRKLPRKTGITE